MQSLNESIKRQIANGLVRTIDAYVKQGQPLDQAKQTVKGLSVAGADVWEIVLQLI